MQYPDLHCPLLPDHTAPSGCERTTLTLDQLSVGGLGQNYSGGNKLAVGAKSFAQRGSLVAHCRSQRRSCYRQARLKSPSSLTPPATSQSALSARRRRRRRALSAGRRARPQSGRTLPSRGGSQRPITSDDRDRYFRRKSQIFKADAASGAG
jgi:hypothetical protein